MTEWTKLQKYEADIKQSLGETGEAICEFARETAILICRYLDKSPESVIYPIQYELLMHITS